MMAQQTANDLRAARALIERGWCQLDYAQTRAGNSIGPKCPNAAAWCAGGAIDAVTDGSRAAHDCIDALILAISAISWLSISVLSISRWNDMPGRTQAEVLAAFDRAIAAEEQAP